MPEDALLVSVTRAARIVGIGKNTAYRLVNEGTWKTVEVGKQKKVPLAFLRETYTYAFTGKITEKAG